MNRIKRVKTDRFVVMANEILWNKNLSAKAKGFYAIIMGLPETWDFTMSGLAKIVKESKDAIASGIDELEAAGYVVKERVKDKKGRFSGINYTFFETARIAENPFTGNPLSENTAQVNTISIENNKSSYEDLSYLNTHITHALEKDAIGTAEERPQPNLVTKDWLDQWAWPERNLFAAFPEYFDQRIALGRINQTHIIAIRSAVRPGDEQAWQETIEDYQLAFDPVIGRYLPDKINNVLGVFRNKKQRIERELSQNGTNQQPYAKQRRTDADVIRESAEFYAKWRRNVEQPDPGNALSPL